MLAHRLQIGRDPFARRRRRRRAGTRRARWRPGRSARWRRGPAVPCCPRGRTASTSNSAAARDVVERQVGEALVQEQVDELIEQLRSARGATHGRGSGAGCHTARLYCSIFSSTTPEETAVPVDRLLPTHEARDLIELTRDIADKVLAPEGRRAREGRDLPRGRVPRPRRRPGC